MEPQASPPKESVDATATFRKPASDTANRKYRRRSPSSSSDGSPLREHKLSPLRQRKEVEKGSDDRRKREDSKESERNHYGRNVDSYRNSDHHSSRSSRGYHRHDDYHRRDKGDRYRGEKEQRSRGNSRDDERYSRAKSDRSLKHGEKDIYKDAKVGMDENNDNLRSSREYRSYEGSRSHKNDSKSRRNGSGNHSRDDIKDGENYLPEKKKSEDREKREDKPKKQFEVEKDVSNRDEESSAKKPKISGFSAEGATAEQASLTNSDIDAAKVAAMKAAEMVNRNLIGTGLMSTDQKKKLLWGNKKTVTKEESSTRWDTTTFGDRERQEKFNKLMGVKGEVKVEAKPDTEDVEKKREQLQLDLEKQYTAGLRRRDGRTVGLGL